MKPGEFIFQEDAIGRLKKDSDGTWICKACGKPAKTEHNNPECHRCSDWYGCNRDCTLSRVYCTTCATEKTSK